MNENIKEEIFSRIMNDLDLTSNLKKQIESDNHLKSYYSETKAIYEQLFSEPISRPESDYWQRLGSDIVQKITKKNTSLKFVKPILAAAALLIVFMGGYWFSESGQSKIISKNYVEKRDLRRFFQKSQILLTTFINMEREEIEILPLNIFYGNQLLKSISDFQTVYSEDDDLQELLAEMERIILMIQSLKNKSDTSIRSVQNGIERINIIDRLDQINI